jgi:hypothetical protein
MGERQVLPVQSMRMSMRGDDTAGDQGSVKELIPVANGLDRFGAPPQVAHPGKRLTS